MAKAGNLFNVLHNIYHNEFQWMLVKSFGMFFIGVRLAQEFVGVELMPTGMAL